MTMKPINNILGLAETQPWHNPVDGQLLLDDLVKLLRRFVVLPRSAAETLALWTLHTYAFDLRDISAYIGLESPENLLLVRQIKEIEANYAATD